MPTSATASPAPLKTSIGSGTARHVAFCGPLGVGKTTAVRVGSSTEVTGSEVASSLFAAGASQVPEKRTTTVGIEYGEWRPEAQAPIAIYGTPGQARFSDARDGAITRRSAVVLWLYGQNDYALDEAAEWLDYVGKDGGWEHLTVAVTRLEEPGEHPGLEDYRPLLDRYHPGIPLVAADPRDVESVRAVLLTAVATLEDSR